MPKRGERTAERVTVTCPCGKQFVVLRSRYEAGRGRYCSRECKYRHRIRPSGLKYNITQENRAWFKPGCGTSETSFQPGHETWNKGRPTGIVPPNAWKPGETAGAANAKWAGDDVGYKGLHIRLYGERGKAADYPCQYADETCKGPMNWANVSGNYESTADFMPLCLSHHQRYDRRLRSQKSGCQGQEGS